MPENRKNKNDKNNELPLSKRKCIPCEGGVDPLTKDEAEKLMKEINEEWMLVDDAHLLVRTFQFEDFAQSMEFVNKVAAVAEEEGHHPDISINYSDVAIELTTHAIQGLSENDYILAAKIDELI